MTQHRLDGAPAPPVPGITDRLGLIASPAEVVTGYSPASIRS